MKAVIEYGNKKIEVDGDIVRLCKCEMQFPEFEEVANWVEACNKISCFEEEVR